MTKHMTDAREINKAIKASRHVYVTQNGVAGARHIPIVKAKTEQGRLRVQTRYGNWQGIGGIYVVFAE